MTENGKNSSDVVDAIDAVDADDFRCPSDAEWKELTGNLKLNEQQTAALRQTIQDAAAYLEAHRSEVALTRTHAEMRDLAKKAAGRIKALQDLVTANQAAFASLILDTSPGDIPSILSFSACNDVTRNADFDAPIDIEAVKAIVTREGRMERPASIIDIERELVPQKQQLDFEHSAKFMLFLIARLQKPIDLWLANAANNSGGRPMNIVRNVVLFYLIKDAPTIIGEEPSTDSTFMELCDQVTFYCGIAEQGLLERVRRIMKKQESGLAWSRLPRLQPTLNWHNVTDDDDDGGDQNG